MRCSACGFSASASAHFCTRCGARLIRRCESCGFESPQGSQFCGGCGTAFTQRSDTQPPVGSPIDPTAHAVETDQRPERRQVTVLFIDMVGSTGMSLRLDEEEFRDVIYRYRDICASAIRPFDSTLVRYIGDGVLVCFGFPLAHEDDPVRAVRAALALRAELQHLNNREVSDDKRIQVRMGIHSGIVIAGDLRSSGSFEMMGIMGEAPNIASRLQQLAPTGGLVISEATAQLIGEHFDLLDLGTRKIRGASGVMQLYEVTGVRNDPSADALRAVQKMVGRRQELALLQDRFHHAANGEGQLVLVTAEAGAGKTRLLRDFTDQLDVAGLLPITCYCSAYNRTSALYPIIDMIRRVVSLNGLDEDREKLAALQRAFAGLDSITPVAVSLIAELLELPVSSSIDDIAPSQRRQLLLDVLMQWLFGQSERIPVLFIVEDLHWADASTNDLLEQIVQQLSDWHMLAVFTFRPEYEAKWLLQSRVTRLDLRSLSPTESRTLIEQIAGAATIPPDTIDHIVAKTGGIPLYVEEFTKAVIGKHLSAIPGDSEQLETAVQSIPSTLRGSLAARLDRLKVAKPLAQVAATLGRVFDGEVLAAVTGASAPVLEEQIVELLREGFIQQHGVHIHPKYSFRHALIQDAAYDTLLKSERRQMHRRIADVLSTQFPEVVAATPEVVAEHYATADLIDAAVFHWEAAGRKAAQRSAHVEAASHFESALAILRRLPDTNERARRELGLEVDRGSQLLATKGNAAPQVEEVFTRAQELSERLGEHTLLFRALYGLMMFCIVRGQLDRAHELGSRLVDQAERANDLDFLLQAKRPLGLTLFYLGQFDLAKATLESALALYDPERHAGHRFEYGSDPAVLAECNLAWTKWFVGLADGAVECSARAIQRAVQLDHPHSLGFALSFEASVRQARGEPVETLAAADRVIEVGNTYRFPYWSAWGHILRGWSLGRMGRLPDGVAEMEQGLAEYRATGAELIRPYGLMLFAETLASQGDLARAIALVDEALLMTASNKAVFCEPELHRLRGQFLVTMNGASAIAFADFRTAADLAHQMGAHALELRALTSLFSAFPDGYGAVDHARFVEVYGDMTEGFSTADLIEAARVLNLRTAT
ncbi:MAG: AAA family ATPase [Tardiphaga sp.]